MLKQYYLEIVKSPSLLGDLKATVWWWRWSRSRAFFSFFKKTQDKDDGSHREVTGKSPGSHRRKVTWKSLGSHQEITRMSPESHGEVTGKSPGSHREVTRKSLRSHQEVTGVSPEGHQWRLVTRRSLWGSHKVTRGHRGGTRGQLLSIIFANCATCSWETHA